MLSRTLTIGTNALVLTSEDFLNGYQAGHLSYIAEFRTVALTDSALTELLMAALEDTGHSEPYCMGFVVGWLATFACKSPKSQEGEPPHVD
jgi:hypothetical protein